MSGEDASSQKCTVGRKERRGIGGSEKDLVLMKHFIRNCSRYLRQMSPRHGAFKSTVPGYQQGLFI